MIRYRIQSILASLLNWEGKKWPRWGVCITVISRSQIFICHFGNCKVVFLLMIVTEFVPKNFAVLGSAIILEIAMMLLLGGALLLFICKCMTALHKERNDRKLLIEEHLGDQTVRITFCLHLF